MAGKKKKSKETRARYKAENRRDINKERKIEKQRKFEEKKKKKKEERAKKKSKVDPFVDLIQ